MPLYARFWRWLGLAIDRINDWFFVFAGVIIAFMMISICYDVVARSFGRPTIWVHELSALGMLWMTFIALGAASKKGVHVSIDFVITKFNKHVQAIVDIIYSIVIVIIAGVFFWYGASVTVNAYVKDLHELTMLELPVWPTLIVIPIGSLLMLIEYLRQTRKQIVKWRKERAVKEEEHLVEY